MPGTNKPRGTRKQPSRGGVALGSSSPQEQKRRGRSGPKDRGSGKDLPTKPNQQGTKKTAASTTPSAAQDLGGFIDPDLVDTAALEGLGDGILGGLREEEIYNSPATRTQSVAEQSPLALFEEFVSSKARESGSSKADVDDMLKLPSTQPPDPVNVPHAASASNSAEHDIVDKFAIVAKQNRYKEYCDGDYDYCPSPLDRYSAMGLIKSNVNYDDDSAFADEEPEEDMTYCHDDEEKGCHSRKLTEGGPEKPDVSDMDPGRAAAVMKIWQTAQKKYTDSIAVDLV
jgi:hypothetical protein